MAFLGLGISITRGHLLWVGRKKVPSMGVQDQGDV